MMMKTRRNRLVISEGCENMNDKEIELQEHQRTQIYSEVHHK